MGPAVFEGQTCPVVNASMWTIEHEFRCYLLAALVGICGIFCRRRYWAVLAASVIVIALACDLCEVQNGIHRSVLTTFLTINPADFAKFSAFFCAGGCFWIFRDTPRYKTPWALAAIMIGIPCMFWIKTTGIVLAVVGAYSLFGFAAARFSWLERFRTYPDISYGVYLYGWPVQKVLLWYMPALSAWLLFAIALGASCLLGWLSWHLVEHPFLRLKRRAEEQDPLLPVPAMR
jgi:peptidoglycan/LPS O-acetylase OafA/YrhL